MRFRFCFILLFFVSFQIYAQDITSVFKNNVITVNKDIDLKGKSIVLLENSTLIFNGGSISNGTLIGNNSSIEAGSYYIFHDVNLNGTWNVSESYPEWFGAKANNIIDNSEAISKVFAITSGSVKFTRGCYYISSAIHSLKANIDIENNDTIRALSPMSYMILLDSEDYGVFSLRTNASVSGGGVIDGNRKAQCGIVLRKCLGAKICNLTILNTLKYGFQAALKSTESGNSIVENVNFLNPHSLAGAVAVNNNRADCTYQNLSIVNFQSAVVSSAENAKFINIQSWITTNKFWENSIAFDCYSPYIIMYGCSADTMRRLIKCHNDYFFASLVNCAAFKNDKVVSDDIGKIYPPVIIDKNGINNSQIQMIGGVYWYNIPYQIFSEVSSSDQILINRYNSNKANIKSNISNSSNK